MLIEGLGISKTTFYKYYASPVDLVPRMINTFCWAAENGPDNWFILENDMPFHLVATLKNLVRHFELKGWVIRIAYEIALSSTNFQPWWKFRDDCAGVYADNIARQQELGLIRSSVKASDVGYQMFDLNVATYHANYWPNAMTDSEDVLRQLAGVWLPVFYQMDADEILKRIVV